MGSQSFEEWKFVYLNLLDFIFDSEQSISSNFGSKLYELISPKKIAPYVLSLILIRIIFN